MNIKRFFQLGILSLFFGMTTHGTAASFDCSQAKSAVDQTICHHPELSDLDEQLAEAYKNALVRSSDANQLKNQQRDWIKQRNACKSAACLKQAYEFRLNFLKNGVSKNTNTTTRTTFPHAKWVGQYVRKVKGHPAVLEITRKGEGLYFNLSSVYEVNIAIGNVRTGEIEGKLEPIDDYAIFALPEKESQCKLYFDLKGNKINIKESQCQEQGGSGVYFSGAFVRK